jgi:hypothetical protein
VGDLRSGTFITAVDTAVIKVFFKWRRKACHPSDKIDLLQKKRDSAPIIIPISGAGLSSGSEARPKNDGEKFEDGPPEDYEDGF